MSRPRAAARASALLDAFREVFRNREIRHAEAAWTLGVAAEWAWLVTLLVTAHEAGGVVAVGLVGLARTVPAAMAAPFITTLADRLPRERVLLAVHVSRASVVALAAVVVTASLPLGLVYLLAVVEGTLATLHRPANAALLPGLARSPRELVGANAVASTLEGLGVLVGPAAAGLVLAAAGPGTALALPVASFALAALAIGPIHPARSRLRSVRRGRVDETLAGARALRTHPAALTLVGLFATQTFVRGLLTVLLVSAALGPLGLGQSGVGYLNAAIGAGGVLGAVGALGLMARSRLGPVFTLSLAAWGLPIALIGLVPHPAAALAFLAVIGTSNALLDVAGFSLIQRIVPNEVRGRVFGALEALVALTVGLGSIVGPLLVGLLDVRGALIATGLILPVLAVASARAVRRTDAAAVVPEAELSALRGVPIFAPLPMTSLETLAAALTLREVPAGTNLVQQGEVGERYYIVSSGAAVVTVDDRPISRLGPGDGFGEIALLRDVPRTATVTTSEDAEVYELDREAFLEAVTGSRASQSAADAVVAQRLAP